jgi:putative copper export protein
VHLLAVSAWAGSLIALLLTGFHILNDRAEERRKNVAGIVIRWSALAGISLAIVVVTGIYNIWPPIGPG